MDALTLLRRSPIFALVSEARLLPLVQGSCWRPLRSGEVLAQAGDLADSLFLVAEGAVQAITLPQKGERELTLCVVGAQQMAGGSEVFVPGARFSAQWVASQPTRVLVVPAAPVQQLIFASPEQSQLLVTHLVRREQELAVRLERLMFSPLGARLAVYLLSHAEAEGWTLPRNSVLAAELGSVPEVVSRKLGEFYRLGLIGLDRRMVRILNREGLKRMGEGMS